MRVTLGTRLSSPTYQRRRRGVLGVLLRRTQPRSTASVGRPLPSLYRLSIGRRPWSISNGAFIVSLIVALATCLAAFTASYDSAKVRDARYANGADIRISPSPTSGRPYTADDAKVFQTAGIAAATPVVYELSNVILRSARTSDPANLAAVDPARYPMVAPLSGSRFTGGSPEDAFRALRNDPTAILVSEEMAAFLKAEVGDTLQVVLARATDAQVEVPLHITALFERLPGFPDGADAVMAIAEHTAAVPSKNPDFFLAATERTDNAGLRTAVESLRADATNDGEFQIDTRATTLTNDQSSLAALNIAGLVELDTTFSLAMAVVTIAIFVFGLLLQRRREYITLRASRGSSRPPSEGSSPSKPPPSPLPSVWCSSPPSPRPPPPRAWSTASNPRSFYATSEAKIAVAGGCWDRKGQAVGEDPPDLSLGRLGATRGTGPRGPGARRNAA